MTYNDYFQSYKDYFWQWEENTEVLAIPQGNTIAYRAYVSELLERLSAQGLPPFGALLLTIIATNPGGRNSIDVVYSILHQSTPQAETILAEAVEFLKLLSEVPEEFKTGKRRMLLLQAIFENCHNILSRKKSKGISDHFNSGNFRAAQPDEKKDFKWKCFRKDLKTLEVLKNRFTNVNSILEKVISIPDFSEELVKLETTGEQEEEKDLTEQLIENHKTFYVGSLIKYIWSGLNIPLHSTLPSQQPLGGVADLTNKGDFDKLLISEFANDDIVFLSRLANNEALYIHREIPPASNKLERIILLDVSLKNWGTPKTLSFATMLAIARHPKTDIPCSAFTIGNTYHPVSIKSVDTILEGLQFLEGSLHAANGLSAFFNDHTAGKNREIFFITEPSTLKQPAMAKAMNDYKQFINYWIFTDSTGNIDIYKKQQSSKKHIQHLQLPLEKLWEKQSTDPALPKRADDSHVSYPILFRSTQNVKSIMTTADRQTFVVTGDKALLRFFEVTAKPYTKGWELMLEHLPVSNGEFEMGLTAIGEYVLLMFNMQTRDLILVNLNTGEKKSFAFPNWKSVHTNGFVFYQHKFFHLNSRGCWSIDFDGIKTVDMNEGNAPGKQFFDDRTEELKKALTAHRMDSSAFKNLREIYINENNQLVFNIHELFINSGLHLKLELTTHKRRKLQASKKGEFEFIFPDGSSIEVNKSGLFILKSSDANIPVIYISSFLDFALGAATETAFAGNEFHYPEQLFDIHLIDAGKDRLNVTKILHMRTNMGLGHVHGLIHNAPARIFNYMPKHSAVVLQQELKETGATVEIRPSRPAMPEIEKVSVPYFYQKYIGAFIQHILHHGA